MKIAIPTFDSRVSPRFDCARSFLVVTVEDNQVSDRQEVMASHWQPNERIDRLLELGVDSVICGGIDRWSVGWLRSSGITVYGWVSGEVEEALQALLKGDLDEEVVMEGGRCRCRRFLGDKNAGAGRRGQDSPNRGRRGRGRGCGRGFDDSTE